MLLVFIVLIFTMGQNNAYYLESQIKSYCNFNVNYSISPTGLTVGLWNNTIDYIKNVSYVKYGETNGNSNYTIG